MSACKSISTLLLSTTILTGMSVTAFSQEAVFVGPGNSWTDVGNWKAGKVPDSGTDVLIKGHQVQSTISGTTAKKITIEQGGVFIFSGTSAPAVSAKEIAVMDKGIFAFYDKTSSLKLEDQITVANGGRIGFMNDSSATNLRLRTSSIGMEQPSVIELHMGAVTGGVLDNVLPQILFRDHSSAGSSEITVERLTVQFAHDSIAGRANIKLSEGGRIALSERASLGSATVESRGGSLTIQDNSTLGASALKIDSGSVISLVGVSDGGTAHLHNEASLIVLGGTGSLNRATLTNGTKGFVLFGGERQGGSATIINDQTGTIQAATDRRTPIEVGSLSGAGDVYIGNASLVTGALRSNDQITGVIHDGYSQAYRQLLEGVGRIIETEELTPGGLRKVGVGTLTLTGTNTYSGGTTIEAGTLQLGDGGTSGSIEGDIANNAKLVFKRSGDVISANTISGTGEIVQAGPGALLLTADSSDFAGITTVENGRLLVGKAGQGAVLGGSVTVLEGAKLGGSGTVGSGVGSVTGISSGGTLAAGNSIGTLTIDGDLRLAPGSYFETEIAGDGRSDLVNVTGKANLAGSNIRIVSVDADTSYQTERSYRILNADGGVDGVFSDTQSSSAFLNVGLVYAPKSVDLKIALANDHGYLFPTVAQTPNQLATARGLDTLAQSGSSLALYNDLLMLNADEARASFDRLSGEAYATAAGILVDQSHFVRNTMNGRMQQTFGVRATSDVQDTKPYFAWSDAYGVWGSHDGNRLYGEVTSSISGFASGIDVEVDTWRVGIMAGYGHSSFDVNERSSSGDSKNYTLGTYAASQWTLSESSALNFRSGLAHTWHDLSMNRNVAFPGLSDRLSSEYDASTLQLFAEVGYELNMDRSIFEPYANAGFVHFNSDEFGEVGLTAAPLSVTSATMNTWFTTIGLRAATELDIGETLVTARGDIGWRHSYGDVTATSTASFVRSDAFTVSGAPIARDVALIEAGFDIHLTKSAKLGVSYNGQFGSGTTNNGVNAKFSVKF
ncbi:autotransporter outer membrane beta-barrel domain-containing protein [Agrobacterium tumefaciens]|uniref:autotransporter outer membrane beta-barrel domain-containing protein n=1 Tax=Agrobacterium tumefaciens TaxID=358 RepID=UPI0021D0E8E8|nr:autotransporter domain-containing protein [Agrobacterium tumefaciens]